MSAPGTLHFMCGKAGAGKSTLARQLAERHGAILLSEDIWLVRLFGDRMHSFDDYREVSRKLKSVVGPLVIELLKSGQTVVLDFPANTRLVRTWFLGLAHTAGALHQLHVLDTPDALCLQRIAQRNIERPEGSHHLSEADFAHVSSFFEPPQPGEGLATNVYGSGTIVQAAPSS